MSTNNWLERARKTVLDNCETLVLHGDIKFTVPPVPIAVMPKFCSLIRSWDSLNGADKGSELEFMEKCVPLIDALSEIFWLTVTTLDADIPQEAVQMLITFDNFFEVQLCLMRTSGLAPKEASLKEEKDTPKKAKTPSRTGKK